jgi:MoxR-like ATPase
MPRKSEVTTEILINTLTELHGPEVDTIQVRNAADSLGVSYATACKRLDSYKSSRGKWNLTAQEIQQAYEAPSVNSSVNYIPEKDDSYVQFGNFQSVRKVVQSRQFYPIFITGLSGNGKTMSVEQACAAAKRELIRVNITIETDEDDLIGGFRLVNGDTVWHNGPVIEALERGAVLLLDEIDLASNKILCLQSVLEGKGVFLKKIGKYVKPAQGFNVIATANTKGKGSDDGRFVGTNILNEAFLERFPVTFEQEYPSATVETKILQNAGADDQFAENLVKWAGVIRKTFFDGGVDEVITTRRLVHIVQAYSIFGDRLDAITKCVNRFDDDTKQSFLDLYTKVDAGEDSEYNTENSDLLNDQ